jgi:hypothetical protein
MLARALGAPIPVEDCLRGRPSDGRFSGSVVVSKHRHGDGDGDLDRVPALPQLDRPTPT